MVFQNWMTGCGFTYNETAAELLKNVSIKTMDQIKQIDSCGFNGPFIMAWVGLAFLIIILILAKRWLSEEEVVGIPYNWLTSSLGILVYFVVVSFGMSSKWGLLIGLASMLIAGFGIGTLFGGGE